MDGKIPLAGACFLVAWLPLDKVFRWEGDQKEEQPVEGKYHPLKVWQKKETSPLRKSLEPQSQWTRCLRRERGRRSGWASPLRGYRTRSWGRKADKQIVVFYETTKRKYVRLILLSCSLPHFLLHLCIFRHLKEAAVKLKLTIVDNFTPSPSWYQW